jgi:hypothetical protein
MGDDPVRWSGAGPRGDAPGRADLRSSLSDSRADADLLAALHLSPTFVFVSVVDWTFLLGGSGAFLAVPLLLGMVAIAGSFGSTRWFAALAASK